jgi:hypothetical protein
MMLPYCTGCWEYDDDNGVLPRDFWDYWTGKFLIFESTAGPHTLHGSSFVGAKANYTLPVLNPESESESADLGNPVPQNVGWTYLESSLDPEQQEQYESTLIGSIAKAANGKKGNEAYLSGNPTFAMMGTKDVNVWVYNESIGEEGFDKGYNGTAAKAYTLQPTQSFLYINLPSDITMPIVSIASDGQIVYGSSDEDGNGDNPGTGTHMPTVGGGNDLFITAIAGGINVAVAYPQHVRVLSATGAVLYSGMVQTSVDVLLPTDGIYIVSGEKEVQKILY